jgi:hypothetical protein
LGVRPLGGARAISDPTIEHLRVQAFSDLAYGAQAIQYFHVLDEQSDVWNFHEGPIDRRTPHRGL